MEDKCRTMQGQCKDNAGLYTLCRYNVCHHCKLCCTHEKSSADSASVFQTSAGMLSGPEVLLFFSDFRHALSYSCVKSSVLIGTSLLIFDVISAQQFVVASQEDWKNVLPTSVSFQFCCFSLKLLFWYLCCQ